MYFARVILAVLVAVSVAAVPTTGSAAISAAPTAMSMANQTDMPCCPAPDDDKGLACAFKCLNLVVAMFPAPVTLAKIADGLPSVLADVILRGQVISPT